jgi:phosphoenolpyruvate carboxylase
LSRVHELGAELSLAAHLADVSEDLRALAERSPDTSPHRSGEPIAWRYPASMRG